MQNIVELIKQTEQEADQIASAIRRAKGIVAVQLEKQSEEVDKRYEALLKRKNELESSMTRRYLTDDNILNLLKFREIVAIGLQNPTFEDKRRWLELLQVEINIKNKTAKITCRLPIDPYIVNLDSSNNRNGSGGGPSSSLETKAYGFRISRNLKIKRRRKWLR